MRILRFALVAVTACALTGCFDLGQDVTVARDGSGQYTMTIMVEGAMADAIKSAKSGSSDNPLAPNKATVKTSALNGKVIKTATADFKSFSDLKLKDERMSLKVLDAGFLGITPKLVRFRHSFAVGNARAERSGMSKSDEQMGQQMLAGLLGNHQYSFSVTVPGTIERIAPLNVGGVFIPAEVTGDYWHHTVTWNMPLTRMIMAKDVVVEVDFSAVGSFADAQTR